VPYSQRQVKELQDERTGDPLGRGYAVMTNLEFWESVTAEDRDNPRIAMSAGEIFEQINATEFTALSASDRTRVDRVLGLGAEVIIGPGNAHQAVQELIATFGGGSNTIAALALLRDQKYSRAEELSLPPPILADVNRTT